MDCPKCGTENREDARFCNRCYHRFPRKDHKFTLRFTSNKSVLILLIFLSSIAAFIGVFLFIGSESVWRFLDKEIITEYNQNLEKYNAVLRDHDRLIQRQQTEAVAKDPDEATLFAQKYSQKAKQYKPALNQFKLFIENNDTRIRRVGINPDYLRDNIKATLLKMAENEERFLKKADALAKEATQLRQQANQPATDALNALKKLQARCLVGITYQDYTPALGEVLHQIRMFIESPVATKMPGLVSSMRKTMTHYVMLKEVWDEKWNANFAPERRNRNLLKQVGALYPELSEGFPFDEGIRFIMNKASQELKETEVIYENSLNLIGKR